MVTYDLNNNTILLNNICKITPVISIQIDGKNKYYFKVHLSGNVEDSYYYNTAAQAQSKLDDLKLKAAPWV